MERPLPKPGDVAHVEARLLEALAEALEPSEMDGEAGGRPEEADSWR